MSVNFVDGTTKWLVVAPNHTNEIQFEGERANILISLPVPACPIRVNMDQLFAGVG